MENRLEGDAGSPSASGVLAAIAFAAAQAAVDDCAACPAP